MTGTFTTAFANLHGVASPLVDVRARATAASSDEALMLAFREGDSAALEKLFDRHAARIESLILRLTRDPALACDITQTTFLSVVRGAGRYVDGCRFRPWLSTIAMNALRDHLRRRRREVLMPQGTALFEHPPDADKPPPDARLSRQLETALARLPFQQRQAVLLHQLEGFSFVEIAEIVGCSRSAAKVRAHRGYQRLRELLGVSYEELR